MATFRNRHSIEIARPAADVFPWLVEPEKVKRWMRDLREYELESSELGPGARSRGVLRAPGRDVGFSCALSAYDPPRSVTCDSKGKGFHLVSSFDLAGSDGVTRLDATLDLELGGLLRFAGGAVRGRSQERLERDLERLKELLEHDAS